jgi:hypothetical protein
MEDGDELKFMAFFEFNHGNRQSGSCLLKLGSRSGKVKGGKVRKGAEG